MTEEITLEFTTIEIAKLKALEAEVASLRDELDLFHATLADNEAYVAGVCRERDLLKAGDPFGVITLKRAHSSTWREKPESYWLARLLEEFGELGASLANDHEHPPEWELKQIAAIAMNWLEMRAERQEKPKEG